MSSRPLSFQNDIAPIFTPFWGRMLWRFDLSKYDHVKANAQLIATRISHDPNVNGNDPMPPANFPPLRQEDIDTFNAWVAQGCPE